MTCLGKGALWANGLAFFVYHLYLTRICGESLVSVSVALVSVSVAKAGFRNRDRDVSSFKTLTEA